MISVILPLKDEKESPFLTKNLDVLQTFEGVEILPVVKGTPDSRLLAQFASYGINHLQSAQNTRAGRINDGIEQSQYPMVLVIHPRSSICKEGIVWLIKNREKKIWGGFTHQFDLDHPLLKFTSWYSNNIRGQMRGIVYMDHCIFFNKQLLNESRPVPEVDIFEDTRWSYKLNKIKSPIIANFPAITSAVRFQKNGVLYQSTLNQILKVAFLLGASDKTMNKIYEKGLNLN